MPINASPHFEKAQAEYEQAQTTEQKIRYLKKMITLAPKHKGAENLRAQLKRRLSKLKYTKEKESKKAGSTKKGIRKEEMQAVIVGESSSGKSWLLKKITNANPKLKENLFEEFTTKKLELGIMKFCGANVQIIENPAIDSNYYDKGLTNTTDTIIITVTSYEQIERILKKLPDKKKIIVYNNFVDKLPEQKRKIKARLETEKYDYVMIEPETLEGIEKLKEKIFKSFNKMRVYTKEPGKEKSEKPIILPPDSTIKDVAEKILHGFSDKIKQTKIWGPSSKFPGQKVGLKHKLKDLDVVEFKTK